MCRDTELRYECYDCSCLCYAISVDETSDLRLLVKYCNDLRPVL